MFIPAQDLYLKNKMLVYLAIKVFMFININILFC